MSRYDEDLYENPFFLVLEKQYTSLFDEATVNRWIICIPRYSAVRTDGLTERDFQDHILQPLTGDTYQTVSGCEVEISGGQINLQNGFPEIKQVDVEVWQNCQQTMCTIDQTAHVCRLILIKILFEETFYNNKDESYRVLCISSFFNKKLDTTESDVNAGKLSKPPSNYDDCINILWRNAGSSKTKEQVDKALTGFCIQYQKYQGGSIDVLAEMVSGQLTQAMQMVLKDQNIRRSVQQDEAFMTNLRIAVEMYMMNAVHKHLFSAIQLYTKSADAAINKKTRNLVDIRLHQLGVRKEFEDNLPGAKKELAMLNQYSTPMGRLLCLKRVFAAITKPLKESSDLVMTTDDLLPLLIYLIIKSQIPNWSTNLLYMKHFQQITLMDQDEISFHLSSVEAALNYISSDELRVDSRQFSPQKVKPANATDGMLGRQMSGGLTSTKEKFFQYVQYGDESAVSLMLNQSDKGDEDVLSKLCHPLCDCAKCTEIVTQSKLNSNKFSINARDDMGRIALHIAAFYGQASLIDILSKGGSLVDATDFMGFTPLHLACQKGYQNIILLLVHFGSDISTFDNEGNTPLHLCAKNGHEDCVKAILFLDILKNKLNVNAKNDMGDTPLHLAAKWGYEGIVRFMLESEASPQTRNRKRQTPLDVAQNPSIKQQLHTACEEPLPVSVPYPGAPVPPVPPTTTKPTSSHSSHHITNRRPSHTSPDVPTISPTSKVSQEYVVIETEPAFKSSVPLIDACKSNKVTTTSVTNLDAVYLGQIEKLYKAIANKDLPLVKFYLGLSEMEDSEDDDDSPTLQDAKSLCHPLCQCSKCQPRQKASSTSLSVNCQNKKGFAPLHISVIEQNMDAFRLFLHRGANVNMTTHKKVTPMHLACYCSNLEMTKMLLKCGGDVNAADSYGEIPVHLASARKSAEIVLLLIQSSSQIDKCNIMGNTPLHLATSHNAAEVVRILLEHGADPNLKNKEGQTPDHFTRSPDVQKLLMKKQADMKTSGDSEVDKNKTTQNQGAKDSETQMTPTAYTAKTTDSKLFDDIKSFDKSGTLKRSKTFDHSQSLLHSSELKLSLSIKSFDKSSSLKHSQTFDRSATVLRDMKRNFAIQSFDSLTLRHVDLVDKGSPLYLFQLARSSYKDYHDDHTEISPDKPENQPEQSDSNSPDNPENQPEQSDSNSPDNPENQPEQSDSNSPDNPENQPEQSDSNSPDKPENQPEQSDSNSPVKPENQPEESDSNSPVKPENQPEESDSNSPDKPENQPEQSDTNSLDKPENKSAPSDTNNGLAGQEKNVIENSNKESKHLDNGALLERTMNSSDTGNVISETNEKSESEDEDVENPVNDCTNPDEKIVKKETKTSSDVDDMSENIENNIKAQLTITANLSDNKTIIKEALFDISDGIDIVPVEDTTDSVTGDSGDNSSELGKSLGVPVENGISHNNPEVLVER